MQSVNTIPMNFNSKSALLHTVEVVFPMNPNSSNFGKLCRKEWGKFGQVEGRIASLDYLMLLFEYEGNG